MAYDIGPRIGIEGEKAFRDAIYTINAEMRALSSEMKVAASEFEKGDNSIQSLTRRNEVLEKQIVKQREALDKLNEGLEYSRQAHGDNSRITHDWQRAVNEATAKLNNMEKELKSNTDALKNADKPTEEVSKEIKGLGENAKSAGRDTLTLGDIIKANLISEAIISGVKALGGAIRGLASSAVNTAKEAAAFADEFLTLSATTGIAIDTLQELHYMEELIDVSLDTMTSSMSRQIRSMANAQRGTKEAVEAYEKLGISIEDNNGNLRDGETVFWEVIDALGAMTNETERDALAMQLMGRNARELVPLMNLGSQGIEEFKQEAREMGAVLSEEALEGLGKYDDALQRLDRSKKILTNTMGTLFAPAMEALTKTTTKYITQFSNAVQEADGDWSKIGASIGEILSNILTDLVKSIPEIINAAKNIIMSFVRGLVASLPEIIPAAMEVISTLVNGIITMLPELINASLQIILALAHGIAESLPTLIPVLVDTILMIVDTLIENIPLLVEAAIAIIIGLAEGLIEALPRLLEKLPQIVTSIVDALIESAPMLIEASIELITALVEGFMQDPLMITRAAWDIIFALIEGLIKWNLMLFNKGKDIVQEVIKGLKDVDIKKIGKEILEGFWQGISDTTSWLKNKIKGLKNTVTDAFKDVFGIRSPSRLFRDEIGQNLALGIGEGFTDTMQGVAKNMTRAIPTKFDGDVSVSGARSSHGNYEMLKRVLVDALKELNLVVVCDETVLGRLVNVHVAREVFA